MSRPKSIPAGNEARSFRTLSEYWLMTKRSIAHITRSLDQIMVLITFPVMFMLLNYLVFGGAIDTGEVDYMNYMLAGVFIQALAFGANYTTINLAVDLKEGIVDRFRSLPMNNSALIVGHVAADLVRNTVAGVIVVIVGLLIGFQPTASLIEWLAVIGIAVLFTLSISCLSAILGLLVRSLEAAQWMGFIVIFPLTFVSSAFVPTETMPAAVRAFAENQPVTHSIDAVRHFLIGTPLDNSGWLAVAWSVGIILVSIPLTTWMFRRRAAE